MLRITEKGSFRTKIGIILQSNICYKLRNIPIIAVLPCKQLIQASYANHRRQFFTMFSLHLLSIVINSINLDQNP